MEMYNVHTHITLNCTIDSLTQSPLSLSLTFKVWSPRALARHSPITFKSLGKGKMSRMQWLLISNRAMTDDQQDLSWSLLVALKAAAAAVSVLCKTMMIIIAAVSAHLTALSFFSEWWSPAAAAATAEKDGHRQKPSWAMFTLLYNATPIGHCCCGLPNPKKHSSRQ